MQNALLMLSFTCSIFVSRIIGNLFVGKHLHPQLVEAEIDGQTSCLDSGDVFGQSEILSKLIDLQRKKKSERERRWCCQLCELCLSFDGWRLLELGFVLCLFMDAMRTLVLSVPTRLN